MLLTLIIKLLKTRNGITQIHRMTSACLTQRDSNYNLDWNETNFPSTTYSSFISKEKVKNDRLKEAPARKQANELKC